MKKISPESAIRSITRIENGMTGIIGCFSTRIDPPDKLLEALLNSDLKDLTLIILAISNNDDPIGKMAERGMLKKVITGFNNSNDAIYQAVRTGKLELEFVPYGTLIEKIRQGAAGIPAFCSPVGVGTLYSEGKTSVAINGQPCILESTLRADFALIRSATADSFGNAHYWHSSRHLNHYAAMAADLTLLQSDNLQEVLEPDKIDTPGIFINHLVIEPKHTA